MSQPQTWASFCTRTRSAIRALNSVSVQHMSSIRRRRARDAPSRFWVEVDPVNLVRNHKGPTGGESSLGQYVNDRPYAASSHLSAALNKFFGTTMSGRCTETPELVDVAMSFEVWLPTLPVRGDARLLEPTLWATSATRLSRRRFPRFNLFRVGVRVGIVTYDLRRRLALATCLNSCSY